MPIYEFRCQDCEQDFEKIILGSANEVKCPHCQSDRVIKKISAFSFKSGSKFVSSSTSGGCSSCSSPHCSTCR